ncbi:universal stress protein [Nonomuraea endophytica]|uniref:Nucleotide-binding universal stress UspA family protein n=1 Tax=Nonomuraea endophytica TaxID=714136 RepID=A0A7W8A012_9ACTN|nr:universal stress protein [Nonomuraea endophytica]MBB5077017.1 nucleotide-binding universal stress UspA family protein [Nonomuraea endophytica]
MKIENVLTGFIAEPRGRDGLALAVLLARQARAKLTVATVQPPAWNTPGPAKADESAWRAYLREQADGTLEQARELAGDEADYVVHTNKGSGRGLVELARKREADVVVIGSAPSGAKGRISLGSTADQLLHSSSVPVLLAPKGWSEEPPAEFERLTVAYRRGPGCDHAVAEAARAAVSLDVPLRLVTLVVSSARKAKIEQEMSERLREQAAADLKAAARGQRRRLQVDVEILEGRNVAQALGAATWLDGELIICASSSSGPLRRVFLGDTSIKIVKAATCPVMILTREP